ncbi:MAG: phosphodiester glycosidase family protein, partial [Syntrophomonas sp.]
MITADQSSEKTNKKRGITIALLSFILVLGISVYLLADRYLIEHVEIANIQSTASAQTSKTAQATSETSTSDEAYTADDSNYKSDSKTISIKKVVTGSGQNTITYYVADVTLNDAGSLQSAFAQNQFGTNIIEYTSQIAADNNAIFAINGDYYGFREDGIVIRNGKIFRDSPARTGLKIYKDGTMEIYDETKTTAQKLVDEGVWQTLSFGPALITNGQIQSDFSDVEIDTNFGNRSIDNSNPRTGIGMISPNHYVFIVVDGRANGYSKGMTLSQFTNVFANLGCTEAYNLDGGGSSTMYFMG